MVRPCSDVAGPCGRRGGPAKGGTTTRLPPSAMAMGSRLEDFEGAVIAGVARGAGDAGLVVPDRSVDPPHARLRPSDREGPVRTGDDVDLALAVAVARGAGQGRDLDPRRRLAVDEELEGRLLARHQIVGVGDGDQLQALAGALE